MVLVLAEQGALKEKIFEGMFELCDNLHNTTAVNKKVTDLMYNVAKSKSKKDFEGTREEDEVVGGMIAIAQVVQSLPLFTRLEEEYSMSPALLDDPERLLPMKSNSEEAFAIDKAEWMIRVANRVGRGVRHSSRMIRLILVLDLYTLLLHCRSSLIRVRR